MSALSQLSRRDIIRQFAFGTASSLISGSLFTQRLLGSSPIQTTGRFALKVSDYPALASALGSVRLDVGLDGFIIVNRATTTQFHVLSSVCQHQGCTVDPFDSGLGVMRCPCHGSQYNIDGSLNQGPAPKGLNKYAATYDGTDTLTITIPGVTHAAKQVSVVSTTGNTRRVKLTFNARIFTNYRVLYQSALSAAAVVTPFSTTVGGSATQTVFRNTVFNPNDPIPEVSVYVDAIGTSGFFTIALAPVES